MIRKTTISVVIIFILALAGCGGAMEPLSESFSAESGDFAMAEPPMEAASDAFDDGEGNFGGSVNSDLPSQQEIPRERLIIRNASMDVVVRDTDEALAAISQMAEANGGWVVDSNLFQFGDNAKRGNITFRIPVEGFNSALEAIRSLAVQVTSESSSGQDVTEEFVDLSARLQNLEATAERVRGFLQQASDVEEALEVNRELSRLESDIEVIKGRMQFLSQSASFSTITVNLTPDILAQPIETGGWRPGVVVRDSVAVLIEALQGIVDFVIRVVIVLLPLAVIAGIPMWLVGRVVWRRLRRRRTLAATPTGAASDHTVRRDASDAGAG